MSLKHYRVLLLDDDERLLTTSAQALGQQFTVIDGRDIWALDSRRLDATMDAAIIRFSADDRSTRRFEETIQTWGRQLPLFAVCQNEADGARAIQLGAVDFCLGEDLQSSVHDGATTAQRLIQKIFISGIRHFQLERQLMSFMHRGSVEHVTAQQILAANSIPLLIVDQAGVIRYLNTAAQLAYGAGADAVFDTAFSYPLNSPRLLNIEFGKSHFNVNIRPIAWQGEPAYLCTLLTLQPSTEASITSVEAGLNRLFSAHTSLASTLINLEAGVFLTAPVNGMQRIIFANAKVGVIFGLAVADLIGRELDFFYGANTDARMVEQLQVAAADGDSFHSVLLSYHQDGTPFWNELCLTPTYNEAGQFTHFVGLTTDVTEKVAAAEQLRYRRQIEQLVTNISSEFVNLPPEQIDATIVDAMARISTFILAERSTLSQIDWAHGKIIATHQWAATHVPRQQALETVRSIDDLTFWLEQLLTLGALQMAHLDQLPPELYHLREVVIEQRIQSILTVPLIRDNKVIAVLSFETVTREHTWSEADVGLLKLVGEIFMRVLDRKATERALRTSEERFRMVMDNTPILMFGFDAAGVMTFAEGSALQTFNVSAESLVGVSIFDAYAAATDVIDNVRLTLAGNARQALISTLGGSASAFETWYIPLRSTEGAVVGGVGVALNVTERIRAQQAEQKQRTLAEALRDTASALLRSLDTDVLMDEILNNVHKIVPHDSATIVLRNHSGRQTYFARGQAKSYEESFMLRPMQSDYLPTQQEMNRTGEPLLIQDTREYADWLMVDDSPNWIRSYLGAPIVAFGDVIGYLNLDSATPGYFTQEHLEGLRTFANQAAIAIQNSQLYDQVKEVADRLNQLNRTSAFLATSLIDAGDLNTLSQAIADAVTQEYGRVECNLILIDGDGQASIATRANHYQVSPWPAWVESPSDPISVVRNERTSRYLSSLNPQLDPQQVPQDGQADVLNGATARLLLPLLTPNGCIGVLDIYSFVKDGFDQSDQNMLKTFAERAAVAIENVRLYQVMQHYSVQLEAAVAERTMALENERAQLRTILNAMEEAVIYWEADGVSMRVRYVNQAFSALTGYPQQEIIDTPNFYTNLILEPRERAQFLGLAGEKSGASNLRFETKLRRQDSSVFDAVVTSTRLPPSASGQAKIRGVVLFRDVSQEKLLQEQKDRFIAHASHEMRTPLTNIKLRLYLLKMQPDKADEHIKVLEQVSARMQELVENLLDVSRFERGIMRLKRSSTELQQVIKDVVVMQRPHADEKSIMLDTILPAAPCRAEVDPDRLAQVITNLVINAINYTPTGGHMEVALEQFSSNEMAIRVTDSGIGMSTETLNHVFTPFFRASEGMTRGTGLGLTISLEIVKLHGGRIEVSSKEGEGTTFLVILPITQNGLST